MAKEIALSADMEQLNGILVADNASTSSLWKSLCGDNLPLVIEILVWVTSDLLTLTADAAIWIFQRIVFFMRVQVDFGILVLERDGIIVADF